MIRCVLILRNWKRYIFHKGLSWNFQSMLGNGSITGGKEKDEARQTVFLTPTNPFGNDPEAEEPHDDYTVPQKEPCVTRWKPNQRAVYWVRLSKALDHGLKFWQTKSFEIMTYATIPGGCIDRALKRMSIASISSIPLPAQTYLAPGNGRQKGRTSLEHKTLRTTPQKKTWKREANHFEHGLWILISATKKSARMHSHRPEL